MLLGVHRPATLQVIKTATLGGLPCHAPMLPIGAPLRRLTDQISDLPADENIRLFLAISENRAFRHCIALNSHRMRILPLGVLPLVPYAQHTLATCRYLS